MKISIIIPVLNSHEAVKRQVRHFRSMRLPSDIEIIIVDDGSNPSLDFLYQYGLKNLLIFPTNDKRPWTQGLARNAGARLAKGEFLFMTDIDHIISIESLRAVYKFTGDKMVFPREFGVLDVRGKLRQDLPTLLEYGLIMEYYQSYGLRINVAHGNTFAIRKSIFMDMGGYSKYRSAQMMHAPRRKGEDCYFNRKWQLRVNAGDYMREVFGPPIYMFPVGRYHVNGENNPKGLFHKLSYEPVKQPMLE